MNNSGVMPPSWLNMGQPVSFKDIFYNNFSLKVGQIIKVNYPDEKQNANTNVITYDVLAQDQVEDTRHTTIYYKCPIMNTFGGTADYTNYTLRPNVEDLLSFKLQNGPLKDSDFKKLLGSCVLLLCLGGTAANPVIIGSLKNPFLNQNPDYDKTLKESKNNGHFFKFSFNGINFDINKFGEMKLNFFGPTNSQGVLRGSSNDTEKGGLNNDDPNANIVGDQKASGSFIKIDKKGDITISSNASGDPEKPNRLIKIQKDGTISVKVDDKNALELKENQLQLQLNGGAALKISDKDAGATLLLGSATVKAAIADHMKQLWTNLKSQLDAFGFHTHPTTAPGSPTGVPAPPLTCPPWDPTIESNKVKFPDG